MSETIVTSGQVLSGATLEFGAGAVISNGGLAEFNQVSAGSFITVSSGGLAQFNVLSAGGFETILSGGTASGTTVLGATENVDGGTDSGGIITYEVFSSAVTDGSQVVFSGGVASAAMVEDLGFQTIEATGTAISTTVDFGGQEAIFTGGIASATQLSGGQQVIFSGGLASDTVVEAGGLDFVSLGGVANAVSVGSGGFVVVESGGAANFGVISSGGAELVLSGGTVSGTTVRNGGTLVVLGGAGAAPDTDAMAGSLVVTAGVVVLLNNDALISAANGTVSGVIVAPQDTEYVLPGGTAIGSLVSGGTENIYASGVASGTMVENDGTENVLSGGAASFTSLGFGFQNVTGTVTSTTVGNLGTETVLSGGSAGGTMISGGGRVTVSAGGEADFAIVSSGGEMVVESGGTAGFVTISNGGTLIVLPGGDTPGMNASPGAEVISATMELLSGSLLISAASGVASGFTVARGESLSIFFGGTAVSSVIQNQGGDIVFSGGIASATAIQPEGVEIVTSGGVAGFSVVSGEGQQLVSGGTASGTTVQYLGFQVVTAGGTAAFTTLSGRSTEFVDSGGVVSFTTVSAGAVEAVAGGGSAISTIVSGGGTDVVSGGLVTGTIVRGGTEDVDATGTADGTQISSGGFQYVSNGGTASGTVISGGGTEIVLAGGVATGAVVDSGGRLIGLPGSVISGTVNSGGQVVTTGVIIVSGLVPVFIGPTYGPDEAVSDDETEYVLNSGLANVTVISGGAAAFVYAGGLEKGGFVSNGGTETLSGGTASKTTLLSGGQEFIYDGGVANFTTVSGTASQTVFGGGKTISSVLEQSPVFSPGGGGIESVSSGGVASGTVVHADAIEYVYSGGSAGGTTVGFNGTELVFGGGIDSGTTVSTGGTEFVYSGGSASGTVVNKGGTLVVFPGAVGNATNALSGAVVISTGVLVVSGNTLISSTTSSWSNQTIVSGQTEYVFPAGTAISSVIADGANDTIYSGGNASGTIVQDGGNENVSSGGSASFTTVSGGGTQTVYAGGVADFTTVSGFQEVLSGGITTSVTVTNGGLVDVDGEADFTGLVDGTEFVFTGGVASGATVNSGARLTVTFSGTAAGTTVSGGGSAVVSSAGVADGTILLSGGFEVVSAAGIASGTVMTMGAAIDLPNLVFSGGAASFDPTTDVLTVTEGGATYSQTLAGGYPGAVFSATADLGGGTLVTLETPCYCRGTLILTANGEVPVEDLRIGDKLLTHKGQMRPIRWMGRRAYAGRFAAGNRDVLPVRIRAWALEDGVPRRDLFISPLHAMYLDGVLIPGRDLVNGTSIEQAEAVDQVDYFHIELETHDVILAEGAPSETFVDDDSRGMFQNAGEYRALYPDSPRLAARYCAPRVEDGEALDVVRYRLAERAGQMMFAERANAAARASDSATVLRDSVAVPANSAAALHDSAAIPADSGAFPRTSGAVPPESAVRPPESAAVPPESAMRPPESAAFSPASAVHPPDRHPRARPGDQSPHRVRTDPEVLAKYDTNAKTGELEGYLDDANRERIVGWARDATSPNHPVQLRISDNGVVIGEVTADQFRDDLAAAGIGAGRYGFEFIVPGGLSPLVGHLIHVRLTSDGRDLPNAPWFLRASPAASSPPLIVNGAARTTCRGHIDQATRDHITGWAWDEAARDQSVALQVLDNGLPVARVLANLYRADLQQAGVGDGRHGFDIHIPGGLSPLARHVIEVTREADGAVLDNSPIVIEAARTFDAAMERTVAQAIAALGDPDEHERVLSFMLAQAEKLRRQHAEVDGHRAERRVYKQIHRRTGPIAPGHMLDPGPRALVVDARMPNPNRDAGSHAILSHMHALQRLGYTVAFIAAEDMASVTPDASLGEELEVRGITHYDAPLYCSVEDVLRRQGDCFDVVYLHRADIAARYLALARAYAPRARILYSVADLHHVRLERQAAIEERPELVAASQRMRVAECTAAWSADAVITHSTDEAELLRRLVPGANVYRVPWDVPVRATSEPFADRHGVAFIGGFDHDPNRDAARWLVETVMPIVWRTDPWIACLLVGSAMPVSVRRLAGPQVEIIGDAADLAREVFDRVRLTVAPLRYGAGVKGKVLDSFAAGVPCVMSEIAAEGVPLPPALKALVGRDPSEMAALICRLHARQADNDVAAVAGISLVRSDCGVDVVTEALRCAIDGRRLVAQAASG